MSTRRKILVQMVGNQKELHQVQTRSAIFMPLELFFTRDDIQQPNRPPRLTSLPNLPSQVQFEDPHENQRYRLPSVTVGMTHERPDLTGLNVATLQVKLCLACSYVYLACANVIKPEAKAGS